ncbi:MULTISPECIES: helix-turn-helix domain-containing protein [Providencia]|uniref:Transcriptional regulator n=2 Tax=Providencia TaxID=586 RepID=A0A1S1HXN5_PROST|nr:MULTISPECIES: helix-turn-helix transcriptional regulator [Providencia]MDV5227656.1 helix-turn-helix transcriptional regulator [Providencia rettgeri]ELR5040150.1 helix-turn-helix transcriptional regulator [Providencia stuartii]ELR5083537.1 helix-turn-helix transcriptional regulator [Providencia stuartii]ELR5114574.1 helix-turn-helix transcriptional regulator [Providencia stuartii]MDX4947370.1 helix-turn-helix transcriptional regulator [Providencia manganoxydans]
MVNSNKDFFIKNLNLEIGGFIRKVRVENGLTGAQLGKLVGVSQQQISRYERGSNEISLSYFIFILSMMDVQFSDFASYSSFFNETNSIVMI